ncbi:MAG: FKBP-type peptidyl-prolyl cis-trans isomerase [Planctomycetales bacterium]|nr:FKBP-type peptidyl-prolyl cis-trans isomerase [Planctomycetales bacterium]MCA9167851.1 FKBP-type peptidyl-prolyl cis-trans isomerase [Planctomycetales bacterium]
MSRYMGWVKLGLIVGAMLLSPLVVQAQEAGGLDSSQQKASYGIGRQIGRDLARGGFDSETIDFEALVAGIKDSVDNAESKITQEQFQAAIIEVQQLAQQRMKQKMEAIAAKNKADGPKFLAKYKAMEGVKALPSGALYKVVKAGAGASPKASDAVRVHYRGRLVDGTEFDSSYKRNEPAEFGVGDVIPGWTEALQQMKVGDRWQLVLPPEAAYGENGSPPVIGPFAVLIFDIELLDIATPKVDELPPQQ